MKKILILFIGILINNILFIQAQEKELTIKDAVIGQWTNLYPGYIKQLKWKGNDGAYTFVEEDRIYESNISTKNNNELIFIKNLSTVLEKNDLEPILYFPSHKWIDNNILYLELNNHIVYYNVNKKKIEFLFKYSEKAENNDFCAESKKLAYTIDNNLYLAHENGKASPISQNKDKGIVTGQTVHRNEFGISKGTFWSPNGNYLAFYRKDETMVIDYPLVDITKREAEVTNTKYPMAGMKSEEVTLGIYNISDGKIIFLKTGEPKEQYLTNIAWGPDEKYIYIAVLNREQNHLKFNKYDVLTGELVKTLFEEKHPKYVEPEHPALFLPNKNDMFIWQSERDNWDHIYLYNTNGEMLKQLTKGNWVVTSVLGFDKTGENLFFMSTKDSPIENHAYKINVETGNITKLTDIAGTHNVRLGPGKNYLIDIYSNLESAKEFKIIDKDGKSLKTLLSSKNPLSEYKLGNMTIKTIKSIDGKTDLYYRLITPPNFDKTKKYPAIIYVYGGPHAQLITNSWLGGARMWQYYMAQMGYVMLSIDNRGSANRGLEFENIIHQNVGVAEMEDQMKGVEFLENLEYVDINKIGIYGWSYGGFMTTSLMVHHNDIFKVGVAGGPVMDWKYYEIMYGERYMDTPDENPDGYKNSCLTNKTDKLKGKLLLIHGYIDGTVVTQHSLDFINECINNNVQVDYFLYPREEHNVAYKHRIHLMQKVTSYFEDYLK